MPSCMLDRQYRCSGDYRTVVLKATDLSWELVTCKDSTSSLIESDADKLGLSTVDAPTANGTGLYHHHLRLLLLTLVSVLMSDVESRGLRLDFSLQSSSYATMLVREVLKKNIKE